MNGRSASGEDEGAVRVGATDRAHLAIDLHQDLVVHGATVASVVEEKVEELADAHRAQAIGFIPRRRP